jgi:hypothetical protein
VAFDQSLMDGMNDLIICQDDGNRRVGITDASD